MIGKTNIGSASGLNFKVTAYPIGTNLNNITGSENEVAILTDDAIEDWYVQTDVIGSPNLGDTVILTSNKSNIPLNIVNKNILKIYPVKVKQYTASGWVEKVGYAWDGSQWKEFQPYLYNLGDQCLQYTGGWQNSELLWSGTTANAGTVTFNETNMYVAVGGGCWNAKSIITVNKVDLTNFNTLNAEINPGNAFPGYSLDSNYGAAISLVDHNTGSNTASNNSGMKKLTSGTIGSYQTYTMDITRMVGEYYILFTSFYNCNSGGVRTYLTIDKVWLS